MHYERSMFAIGQQLMEIYLGTGIYRQYPNADYDIFVELHDACITNGVNLVAVGQ
jgi:hypothetical protein